MGLFDGILGHASSVSIEKLSAELSPILIPGETIDLAYKVIRDLFVFTDKRLILIDKQGVTGRKTDFHSIPYRAITQFSVETAGTFDLDAEMKIWISGQHAPIERTLARGSDVSGIQRALARGTLR
ncbi:PH domain-containing protein [Chenggangzhangella methanolivorans]|uniref:PH domain-containing protein n=1 Tax=Chenggangzhangella methanolivorans TaxID=1437009 RepID=A0A9E6R9F3_9HYPH|nr:PH domain-containing protein [Chenggangzhangella methanolivorans]QZO00638.1 PH domain-containing protein [Chenggangzhangella methanolivorans]